MKKLMTLTFVFFLTAGITFGQVSGNTGVADPDVDVATGAIINQTNNSNNGNITQTSNGAGMLGAEISQNGNNNVGRITQTSEELDFESLIEQIGNRNRATTSLESTTSDDYLRPTETLQRQRGNNNRADIVGTGLIQDLIVKQVQVGNTNTAVFEGSRNAQGYQTQRGNNNTARATGVDVATRIEQFQRGNSNTATFDSPGTGSVGRSYQDQRGNNNVSRVTNFGSRGSAPSLAETYQNGNWNRAFIDFMNDAGNDGLIDQNGNNNLGRILFDGEDNVADIYQTGNNNTGRITQSGAGLASITQNGNGNNANITQNGTIVQ